PAAAVPLGLTTPRFSSQPTSTSHDCRLPRRVIAGVAPPVYAVSKSRRPVVPFCQLPTAPPRYGMTAPWLSCAIALPTNRPSPTVLKEPVSSPQLIEVSLLANVLLKNARPVPLGIVERVNAQAVLDRSPPSLAAGSRAVTRAWNVLFRKTRPALAIAG